jgi:hypothetical protein
VTHFSRSAHLSYFSNTLFVVLLEPRDVGHALSDLSWVNVMHEELENFERNQIWTLVDPPRDVNITGTKWVFKNKQGEDGDVVRNEAHLVALGYSQVEGLDFRETFAPVAHLEAITILLAFATSKGSKLYQMGVKSAFLNGVIQEEVYVRQLTGFESPKYPDRMYKISKALYGLKQASWAWYARLKTFLLGHGYVMGSVDKMVELKRVSTPMSSAASLGPDEDGEAMDQREYRSMIGSLLYLTATRPDIQLPVGLCVHF